MSTNDTIIKPTIGRRLWYWPSQFDQGALANKPSSTMTVNPTGQPCDAGVCYVHGDRLVNLVVSDHLGTLHQRHSVTLVQNGETPPANTGYATWMPYQIGQAKSATPAA